MFRIAEIELGMENTIGITLETGVGVQSAILHVCQTTYVVYTVDIALDLAGEVPSTKVLGNTVSPNHHLDRLTIIILEYEE